MAMFGMFGTFPVQPGKREELAAILQEAAQELRQAKGVRAYVVYLPEEEDRVGVFEVWDDRESHQASLQLGAVRDLITRARPLLAGAPDGREVEVPGGLGLAEA